MSPQANSACQRCSSKRGRSGTCPNCLIPATRKTFKAVGVLDSTYCPDLFAKESTYPPFFNTDTEALKKGALGSSYTLEHYKELERCEKRCSSIWREDLLRGPVTCTEEYRYIQWLDIHDHALCELYKIFNKEKEEDVRKYLIGLWPFLPSDLERGAALEKQADRVKRLTKHTTIKERKDIDDFLNRMLESFCAEDQGDLLKRIKFMRKFSEKSKDNVLDAGLYQTLLKRFLLRTPLMFWPAVFRSGVSKIFESYWNNYLGSQEDYVDFKRDIEYYYTATCTNKHMDGAGYETLLLWFALLHLKSISFERKHVKAATSVTIPFKLRSKSKIGLAHLGKSERRCIWAWSHLTED